MLVLIIVPLARFEMVNTHRPSGSMCKVCINALVRNCSHLDFKVMPEMKRDKDGVIVVRCVDFQRIGKHKESSK